MSPVAAGTICAGCGGPLDETTVGCERCRTRHRNRKAREGKLSPRMFIPRERFAEFLREEIALRENKSGSLTSRHGKQGFRDGASVLADELVAAGLYGLYRDAQRRVEDILTGRQYDRYGREYIQENVGVALVDRILMAIDRPDAWHIELADVKIEPEVRNGSAWRKNAA